MLLTTWRLANLQGRSLIAVDRESFSSRSAPRPLHLLARALSHGCTKAKIRGGHDRRRRIVARCPASTILKRRVFHIGHRPSHYLAPDLQTPSNRPSHYLAPDVQMFSDNGCIFATKSICQSSLHRRSEKKYTLPAPHSKESIHHQASSCIRTKVYHRPSHLLRGCPHAFPQAPFPEDRCRPTATHAPPHDAVICCKENPCCGSTVLTTQHDLSWQSMQPICGIIKRSSLRAQRLQYCVEAIQARVLYYQLALTANANHRQLHQ